MKRSPCRKKLIDIALGIPLPEESLFSLALPDGNGFKIHRDVRNEHLIGDWIPCVPVIRTRAGKRDVHVRRFRDLRLLHTRRVVVIIVARAIVIVIVAVIVIIMTMMPVHDSG